MITENTGRDLSLKTVPGGRALQRMSGMLEVESSIFLFPVDLLLSGGSILEKKNPRKNRGTF